MRQLKPEVANQRKKDVLQWAVHYHIKTSKPVSSAVIAEEANFGLSSATLRNILQELEEEGFLRQPHASSGREPTDKGYRFFVDYLADIQRLASADKEKIEGQYHSRIKELDILLSETSMLLSKVSQSAGLVLSPQLKNQALKRLELIHLGGKNALAILVTEAGLVRHWPIALGFIPSARQINVLNRFLNENIRGASLAQAQAMVMTKLRQLESEFQDLTTLAGDLLKEVGRIITPEALYVEGADNILSQAEQIGDLRAVQSLMRVISEKNTITGLMEREMQSHIRSAGSSKALKPQVRIGQESGIPELAGISLVTTTYTHNGKVVGVLGILGSKRMEYSRMMSLVDYMSNIVSRQLSQWVEEEP